MRSPDGRLRIFGLATRGSSDHHGTKLRATVCLMAGRGSPFYVSLDSGRLFEPPLGFSLRFFYRCECLQKIQGFGLKPLVPMGLIKHWGFPLLRP